jgi:hypothetical protein
MTATPSQASAYDPPRARAVFSTQDFALLRTAILHYLDHGPAGAEKVKLGNLYHRLGRLD